MAEHDGRRRTSPPPPDGATPARSAAGPHGDRLAGIAATLNAAPVQRAANKTGMPDQLKSGVEALSGISLDHVRVHRNSDKPAQLNAHAYAQGADIHLAPGQEQHLPHEAWHVVQQAQGRVRPTMQMKAGVPINDDGGLEHEADVMGSRALSAGASEVVPVQRHAAPHGKGVVQRAVWQASHNLQWMQLDNSQGTMPKQPPTKEGEVFDDSQNKTYASFMEFWFARVAPDDGKQDDKKIDQDFDMVEEEDDEEGTADDGKQDKEEEDEDIDTSPQLTLDDRLKLEREALQRPVDTSLLKHSNKYLTRMLVTSERFNKVGERSKQVGPVSITMEIVQIYELDKPVTRERPIRVSGLVEPTVTKGRSGAPDPISGKQIYFGEKEGPKSSIKAPRNNGMPDAERGHVMALELGGPDIPANIVPQWAKFQGADSWRKMEVAVLKKAKELPKGQKLNYIVEVFYKSSGELTPTLNTFAMPTGFKVSTETLDAKGKLIDQAVEFLQGQSHDITDEKLRERKLKLIDGSDYDGSLALVAPSKPRAKRKPVTSDKGKKKKKIEEILAIKAPKKTRTRVNRKKVVDKKQSKGIVKNPPRRFKKSYR